jgi:hypothetical protein
MKLKTKLDLQQIGGLTTSNGGVWYIVDAKTPSGGAVSFPISLTIDGTTSNKALNAQLNSNDNPEVTWATANVLTFQYVVGGSGCPNSQSTLTVKPSVRTLSIANSISTDTLGLTGGISNTSISGNSIAFTLDNNITSTNYGPQVATGYTSYANQTIPYPSTLVSEFRGITNISPVTGRTYAGFNFAINVSYTILYDGVSPNNLISSYTITNTSTLTPATQDWNTLSVSVSGTALVQPTYKWYYNNTLINNSINGTAPFLINSGTQVLTYKPGTYTVEVTSTDTSCVYSATYVI